MKTKARQLDRQLLRALGLVFSDHLGGVWHDVEVVDHLSRRVLIDGKWYSAARFEVEKECDREDEPLEQSGVDVELDPEKVEAQFAKLYTRTEVLAEEVADHETRLAALEAEPPKPVPARLLRDKLNPDRLYVYLPGKVDSAGRQRFYDGTRGKEFVNGQDVFWAWPETMEWEDGAPWEQPVDYKSVADAHLKRVCSLEANKARLNRSRRRWCVMAAMLFWFAVVSHVLFAIIINSTPSF